MFLGYHITSYIPSKTNTFNTILKLKFSGRLIKFTIPIKKLLERYKNKGFFKIAKKGKNQTRIVARKLNE